MHGFSNTVIVFCCNCVASSLLGSFQITHVFHPKHFVKVHVKLPYSDGWMNRVHILYTRAVREHTVNSRTTNVTLLKQQEGFTELEDLFWHCHLSDTLPDDAKMWGSSRSQSAIFSAFKWERIAGVADILR